MALQPSTQSCRVIWLRAGIARSSASEKSDGRLDQAVDPQPPVGEAGLAACRCHSGERATVLPLVRKSGDISEGSNSRASACDPISRCTRYESHSPDPRT